MTDSLINSPTDSRAITLHYRLTPEICRASSTLSGLKLSERLGPSWRIICFLLGATIASVVFLNTFWGLVIVALILGLFFAATHLKMRFLAHEAMGDVNLRCDEEGLHVRADTGEGHFPWSQVREIEEQPGWLAIVVGVSRYRILPIPETAFANSGERQAFLEALRRGMEGAAGAADKTPPASGDGDEGEGENEEARPDAALLIALAQDKSSENGANSKAGENAISLTFPSPSLERNSIELLFGILSDLRQLGRILLFRAPVPGSLTLDATKFLWLPLFYFLLHLALQMYEGGLPGTLHWYNLVKVFSPFAAAGFIAGICVWLSKEQGQRTQGMRLWLGFCLILLLLPFANSYTTWWLHRSGFYSGTLYYLPYLWMSAAGAWLAVRMVGKKTLPRFFIGLFALCAFGWVISLHEYSPILWEPDAGKDAYPYVKLTEDILYEQPRLLEEQLNAIQPGRLGVAEIFFLGVSGYGTQDVFLKETRSVKQLFDERFDAQGHSLILVNNSATIRTLPTANLESLRRALRRMGEQMNGEEDLLFLFLTSHGSRNGEFSLSLMPFKFTNLTPDALRQMLDEAGIQRRVVVVSSCYSGMFIPALQEEHTLVITASAADRNSFGCSNGNEFTDFGRAYFDEALRQTRSFTEAFAIAKARIAEREKNEGVTASLPQMQGGAGLKAQLEAFSAATTVTAATTAAATATEATK